MRYAVFEDRVKMLKDARFSAEEELKAFRLKEEERFKVEVEQVGKPLRFKHFLCFFVQHGYGHRINRAEVEYDRCNGTGRSFYDSFLAASMRLPLPSASVKMIP